MVQSADELGEVWRTFLAKKFEPTELEKIRSDFAVLPKASNEEQEAADLTEEEFVDAVRRLKRGKATGPDGIPVEFFKNLNEEGLNVILDILNDCWKNEVLPDEMELAELVTLYKKGLPFFKGYLKANQFGQNHPEESCMHWG